jgi:cobyrinic acid a,c-diamide synthase
MTLGCPRFVIAGTNSGVGKTSLAVGLARCLARRGLRVQTFKVGPDFLDPTYLAKASGRTCYNLDGWMTSRDYVLGLFARATSDADIALVEGVMGMFDGASAITLEGSTAEIALWLDAPVLLVADAQAKGGRGIRDFGISGFRDLGIWRFGDLEIWRFPYPLSTLHSPLSTLHSPLSTLLSPLP